jgi:hypothetical protein
MSTMTVPNFAAARSWKWLVGLLAIVLAIVLLVIGRLGWFDASVLFLLGIILV